MGNEEVPDKFSGRKVISALRRFLMANSMEDLRKIFAADWNSILYSLANLSLNGSLLNFDLVYLFKRVVPWLESYVRTCVNINLVVMKVLRLLFVTAWLNFWCSEEIDYHEDTRE